MAAITQDVIIQLILRYIGGSKLQAAKKLAVQGQKVAIQSSQLQNVATAIAGLGTNVDEIRKQVLENPKAAVITAAKANVEAMKQRLLQI